MGLFKKKETHVKQLDYDKSEEKPIIRASICNGEKVAGIKCRTTATFREIMTIRTHEDLLVFKQMCGVDDVKTEY